MSPVAELEPIVEYVSRRLHEDRGLIPVAVAQDFAARICSLFSELQSLEKQHLESGLREHAFFELTESIYRKIHGVFIELRAYAYWGMMDRQLRERIAACDAEAVEALAEYRTGEEGRQQLAEYFRNDP